MSEKAKKLQKAPPTSTKPPEIKNEVAEKAQAKPSSRSKKLVKRCRRVQSASLLAKLVAYFKKNEAKYTVNNQFYGIEFEAEYMPELPNVMWKDVGDYVFVDKVPTVQVRRRPRRRAVVVSGSDILAR